MTDARMIIWKIADSYNHGPSHIGKAMNRDHSCMFHYKKNFDSYMMNKYFKEKYILCLASVDDILLSKDYLRIEKKKLEDRLKQIDELLGT